VTTDDAALVARIRDGDHAALEQLVAELGGVVKAVAFRVLRDQGRAEDVVQDTFVTFWRAPEKFDAARGSLRTFLSTIAHRRAVDVIRTEVARSRREERAPEPAHVDVEEEVWRRSVSRTVRAALSELGDGEREALSLAYFGGLSYTEVARRLDQPEGTVKSRIRTGMRKLSVSLADVA
jgi:RNA polymerase sigma-70 factor, ECF subfamily